MYRKGSAFPISPLTDRQSILASDCGLAVDVKQDVSCPCLITLD